AIRQVVAINRGYYDMSKTELRGRLGDVARLLYVQGERQAGLHIAEGAGAGAGITHDHEGRVLLLPALADIRATGLLAHRVQAVVTHDFLGSEITLRDGSFHANPVWLSLDRRIRLVRLFRMTRARVIRQV